MTSFTVQTTDTVTIYGIANNPRSIESGVICFHMMPATKESFIPLLNVLESKNILAWTIDFRGHGQSTNNGTLNYQTFEDSDHQKYILDAKAAYNEMKKTVLPTTVIGASIGANIALQLQTEFSIPQSVLLSPGLDYRGVPTLPFADKLKDNQSCFIVASDELRQSGEPAKQEAEAIFKALSTEKKILKIYPNTAHGTRILDVDKNAFDEVIKCVTS